MVLGKVLTDDTDDAHRREVTRAQGKIRSGTAENPLGRPRRRLYGIESNRADNQYAHRYFPIMGFRSCRSFRGIKRRSVMIASLSALAQPQMRCSVRAATAAPMVRRASLTLCCKTAKTCSIS